MISSHTIRVLKGDGIMQMHEYENDENVLEKFGRNLIEDDDGYIFVKAN